LSSSAAAAPVVADKDRKVIGDVGPGHPLFGVDGVAELPLPPPLRADSVTAFEPVVRRFGEFLTRCLLDRSSWALRAAALSRMRVIVCAQEEEEGVGGSSTSTTVTVPALRKVLQTTVDDSVVRVFLESLELVKAVLDDGTPCVAHVCVL
jgi:hypothetical protein